MEPRGTERGCSWSFVPFLGKKTVLLGLPRISGASPAKSVQTIVTFCACHDTTTACWCATGVHLHLQQCCPSPSNNTLFVPVRSGRSVLLKKKKGVEHMFFLFPKNCFSRAAWKLFNVGNQSVLTRLASNIQFGSFQCSLEGG